MFTIRYFLKGKKYVRSLCCSWKSSGRYRSDSDRIGFILNQSGILYKKYGALFKVYQVCLSCSKTVRWSSYTSEARLFLVSDER